MRKHLFFKSIYTGCKGKGVNLGVNTRCKSRCNTRCNLPVQDLYAENDNNADKEIKDLSKQTDCVHGLEDSTQ